VIGTLRSWKLGTRARLLLRGYGELLTYASIDGWLSVDEAIALYELARATPALQPVVVEIGSWQGKSSVVLGRGLAGKDNPTLYCIDPFDASGDQVSAPEYQQRAANFATPLQDGFLANLRRAGVRQFVEVLKGYSHVVAPGFTRGIDLLFLDGDHGDGALQDYRDWAPKVKPGGAIALHDARHAQHRGPARVVEEYVTKEPFWTDLRYVGSMLIARKRA
jgi:hypothetical protein